MKLVSVVILTILAFCLSSCYGSYEAAKTHKAEKERIYSHAYDSVWQKAVEWFALRNTPIKTMDKSSGLIASDYNLKLDTYQSYCDCGTGGSGVVSKKIDIPTGNLNLLIKKVDDNHTKVTISTFFKSVVRSVNSLNGDTYDDQLVDCNSTGQLEKEILEALQ